MSEYDYSQEVANELLENAEIELESLRKDAERYRWLRNQDSTPHVIFGKFNLMSGYADLLSCKFDDEFDAAIDAAIDAAMGEKK